jgi:putative phosphoserine phosphatase / 1-acylglycerol-3-phosphate O-acyltransferase
VERPQSRAFPSEPLSGRREGTGSPSGPFAASGPRILRTHAHPPNELEPTTPRASLTSSAMQEAAIQAETGIQAETAEQAVTEVPARSELAASERGGSGRRDSAPEDPGGEGPVKVPPSAGPVRSAVFVDLDRTLLNGASGPVIDKALRAEGLLEGRPRLPAAGLFYALYDVFGETIAMMAMVRGAAQLVAGWSEADFHRAGEQAAPELMEMVQPYALGVLQEHRNAGRMLVMATTTPAELVEPLADALGFDRVIATRYARRGGTLAGGIEGDFVWGLGKLSAVRRFAKDENVDLKRSHAYSDSFYDTPLLRSVGHPHALKPDARLRALATLMRWPIEHWDRPPGVPKIAGVEPYYALRLVVRPEMFPYARFNLKGVDRVPSSGGVLLAANHRSYFDVVALALVAARLGRPVRFLGKREIFDAPLVGLVARGIGGIPVDRGSGSDRPLREAAAALRAGEVVVVLPQGTIPRGPEFFDPQLRGKTGTARLAQMTGAPVVPIGIWGTERVWPRSSRLPNMLAIGHPPKVKVRVGRRLDLSGPDAVEETARLMGAISALLPKKARRRVKPTPEELARTYPPGHRHEKPAGSSTQQAR